jgi:spore maturation protein CgeB
VKSYSYVFLGLSITSAWGNGHATTYRGLLKNLTRRGHNVLFLERDLPFYANSRDLPAPPYARTELYHSFAELTERFGAAVRDADMVVVGSYVPEGVRVGSWVLEAARGKTAFYDIDTPVTLGKLERGDYEYLTPALIPRYDLYLSFTGGPTLGLLERAYGAKRVRPLYCSVDADDYYPEAIPHRFDLGYLGTYSDDRKDAVERLLIEPARRWPEGRFAVAGAQYPRDIAFTANTMRAEHIPPGEHRAFYNAQRFTLNVTRKDMIAAGYSPSVRLFEAAACGVPVISDNWPGLSDFFEPGKEILLAETPEDVLGMLRDLPDAERVRIGERARARTLAAHTAGHRAEALERYTRELIEEAEVASRAP